MNGPFVAEKAIGPVAGKVTWLVLDDRLDPVDEVTQFALYLDGGGASVNTLRAYIPPACPVPELVPFPGSGVDQNISAATDFVQAVTGSGTGTSGRVRAGKTVNAHITRSSSFSGTAPGWA